MPQHAQIRLSLTLSFRIREGHRDADHEHEGRLDHVPQCTADPLHVAELILHRRPEVGVWVLLQLQRGRFAQAETDERQHDHDQTAIGIQRP
jgi:hypothetical protein